MNYIEKIRKGLHTELGEISFDLLDLYILLVLVKGKECKNQDVHDAWSVWQDGLDPGHKSLIPFGQLTKEVQDLDTKYRDAIIKVSTQGRL